MKIFKFLIFALIAVSLMAIAIPAKSPPTKHATINLVSVPTKFPALVDIPAIKLDEQTKVMVFSYSVESKPPLIDFTSFKNRTNSALNLSAINRNLLTKTGLLKPKPIRQLNRPTVNKRTLIYQTKYQQQQQPRHPPDVVKLE